ncbi:sigma-70 family RNA polymerase sigma factor [Paenisporosarcina sp. TG-14]|uniref:sigma-70 family RNA polymerase sigma factor n=1 Tax=Paenisporosarcina sp. TG-14 TaxID=1231057 RepID=UPI0002F73A1A|nr:sigma-70 family RNA polymerase sigma factor [Paenisporosarcina sp. TG-14]
MTTIWADDLIQEYDEGRKQLGQKRNQLNRNDPSTAQDLTMINSMISEMSFAIEWMSTGKQPGTYKGTDERLVYQKRSFESMDLIPDITNQLDINDHQLRLSEKQKKVLVDVFASFSLRERQCYILHAAREMSMSDIAEEIGIKKRTVQQYIERARKKVQEKVS